MKERVGVIAGLAAVIALVGGVVIFQGGDPTGAATGASKAKGAAALWQHMGTYRDSYLKSYRDILDEEMPEPIEVLEAFNEVGFAVTGPGGFWRKTVHNQWLGCGMHAESEPCKALADAEGEFQKWDAFQEKIGELSDSRARRFLAKNHKKMKRYLETYVPSRPGSQEMEATGFYKSALKDAMESGVNMGGDDDL